MRKIVDPFHGLKRYEQELKRHDLYKEIKELLIRSEAYDDSGIGHEFVKHYERELPGIITAHTGDHSFINGTPEENYSMVMEAIERGTVLKAGIIAAVLLLAYKILNIIFNGKKFEDGVRGSSAGNAKTREELKTVGVEIDRIEKEMPKVVETIKNNPLLSEEDSEAMKSLEQIRSIVVYNPEKGFVPLEEEKAPEPSKVFDSLKKLTYYVNAAQLPMFFALKNKERAMGIMDDLNNLLDGVDNYAPNKIAGKVRELIANIQNGDLTAAVKLLETEEAIKHIQRSITAISTAFGISPTPTNSEEFAAAFKKFENIKETLTVKYPNAPEADVVSVKELTDALLGRSSGSNYDAIVNSVGKFNDDFKRKIASNGLTRLENDLKEINNHVTVINDVITNIRNERIPNGDRAISLLKAWLSVLETYSKMVSLLTVSRRQFDFQVTYAETNLKTANELVEMFEKTDKAIDKEPL